MCTGFWNVKGATKAPLLNTWQRSECYNEEEDDKSNKYHYINDHGNDHKFQQSGSIAAAWSFYDENDQREKAFKLGEAVGCSASTSKELLSCMREIDAQVISQTAAEVRIGLFSFRFYFRNHVAVINTFNWNIFKQIKQNKTKRKATFLIFFFFSLFLCHHVIHL